MVTEVVSHAQVVARKFAQAPPVPRSIGAGNRGDDGPCHGRGGEDRRPNAEEFLRRIPLEERLQARGRLKVFLGYASGVGKTFRMLDETHELRREVVLIDVPPRALLNRLRRGVVYSPEKAARAMESFFKEPTLAALRELVVRPSEPLVLGVDDGQHLRDGDHGRRVRRPVSTRRARPPLRDL